MNHYLHLLFKNKISRLRNLYFILFIASCASLSFIPTASASSCSEELSAQSNGWTNPHCNSRSGTSRYTYDFSYGGFVSQPAIGGMSVCQIETGGRWSSWEYASLVWYLGAYADTCNLAVSQGSAASNAVPRAFTDQYCKKQWNASSTPASCPLSSVEFVGIINGVFSCKVTATCKSLSPYSQPTSTITWPLSATPDCLPINRNGTLKIPSICS